ncbi:hypothetical protein GOP47_0006341 [Adiantum capillus-veneris]|uniref:Protein kinase domain-containing protein n=2 Tax=Adiantum capillus-veneris TaxID=13818 RepID=A0A9D4ZMY4_ADICA|nr:hypothetical protein GOP47_0006341 [Adiantum capillus-veneris]
MHMHTTLAPFITFTLAFILLCVRLVITAQQQQQAACLNQTCGGIKVSYPFKLANATGCPSFSSFFELECDPLNGYLLFNKASLGTSANATADLISLRVLALANNSIILDVTSTMVTMKLTPNGTLCDGDLKSLLLPSFPSPYVFSDENQFGGFGCAYGVLVIANPAGNNTSFPANISASFTDVSLGGCDMLCPSGGNNAECGHNQCCVFHWPRGSFPRWTLYAAERSLLSAATYDPESCSSNYATLFHPNYTDFDSQKYGIKLMWALPSNHTTHLGIMQSPEYACSNFSTISLVQEVPGYLCYCLPGYTGDGFAQGIKCSDIDECKDVVQNDCIQGQTTCYNTDGNYTCRCKSPFQVGDGRKSGSGCYFSPTIRNAIAISTSILGLIVAIASFFTVQVFWRKRLKRRYFIQNGGTQLQKLLLLGARGEESRKLFKVEELQAATKNYSSDMKLGAGGFGTVFKGVLANGRVVAIKKSNKGVDPTQLLNELEIMVQINHKSIVKFLGCCLETVEPLLVYEYVSNGNLMENLREGNHIIMNWGQRLKVARQTAEALAYLHGAAVPPILHRDVKSSNVLLDNNFDAKVADFGVSRLVPEGATHISTAVQGTIGYLDPEYFQTLQLTEKSDVYSMGVMLVELITGLKPVDNNNREPRFANLALLFIHYMNEGRVEDVIDPRLHNDLIHTRCSILAVATLALLCLSLHGSQRPLMSHVSEELHHIMDEFLDSPAPLHQPHDLGYHRTSFGAVVAKDLQLSVQTGRTPASSSFMSIDSSVLDCTMPR